MIGWRFWLIDGDALVSPFASTPLPADGRMVAECERCEPPGWSCPDSCGVHYYASTDDMRKAAKVFELGEDYAWTVGRVGGRTLHDHRLPLYRQGFRWVSAPQGMRARTYQVLGIATSAKLIYDVPVTDDIDRLTELV